jgi:hypothetical protein
MFICDGQNPVDDLLETLSDCAPFSALLPLPALTDGDTPWKSDRLVNQDDIDKKLTKCSSVIGLRILMDLSNQLAASSVDEANIKFLNNLCDLHVQLMKQGNRLASKELASSSSLAKTSYANIYRFSIRDCLLKMPFRLIARKYGLPRSFVEFNAAGAGGTAHNTLFPLHHVT